MNEPLMVFLVRWKSDDYEWNAMAFRTIPGILQFFAANDDPDDETRIREAAEAAMRSPGDEFEVEEGWFTLSWQKVRP